MVPFACDFTSLLFPVEEERVTSTVVPTSPKWLRTWPPPEVEARGMVKVCLDLTVW